MTVYMGIDLGWKSMRYEVRDIHMRMLKRGGAPSTPEGLRQVLSHFPEGLAVQVAFEAGSQMHWVNRVVSEMKQEAYAFHAGSFYLTVKSKKKTDKKDAERIARAAAKDNLPEKLYMPPAQEKRLRSLLQEREDFKGLLNGIGNRLHALAIGEGFLLAKTPLTQKGSKWEDALQRFAGLECEDAAQRLYDDLGCRHYARIDLRLDPEYRFYCLELNTLPGLTSHSLTPMAAEAAGIPFQDLIDRIVRLALADPVPA